MAPRAADKQVTKVVISLLTRESLSKRPLDDELARKTFDQLFKNLDINKLYFLQSDLDEFARERDAIDDQLKEGDIGFAYKVFPRLLTRIDERLKQIDQLLAERHDFTVKEDYIEFDQTRQYPQDEADARERWRKRIKYELLTLKSEKVEGQAAVDRLSRRYHSFAARMRQANEDEILENYLNAVTWSFDSSSSFQSASTVANWSVAAGEPLDGIGAQLKVVDGSIVVDALVPGGAADKHGKLQAGDKLVSVAQGETGEPVDVRDMKLNDAVKLIRGPAGTIVRIGVVPKDSAQTIYFDIARAKVELKSLNTRGEIFDVAKKSSGAPYRIGVIDIPSFYLDLAAARRGEKDFRSCSRDVRKLLADFKAQKVDAVMLDLRAGGGSITEAISVAGMFLNQGPVMQVRDSSGQLQTYDDLETGMVWPGPLVALAGRYSNGGSEIVLGALQDHRRALIVGERSAFTDRLHVTSSLNLGEQLFRNANPPQLGVLSISMQHQYRPTGTTVEKGRVVPNMILPSPWGYPVDDENREPQDKETPVPAAKFNPADSVNAAMIGKLKTASEARTAASPEFQKLAQTGQRFQERSKRKAIPLNEQEFLADRAELSELNKAQAVNYRGLASDGAINRDFYLNEVLAITADLASLTQAPSAPLPLHPLAANAPAAAPPPATLTDADRARLEAEKRAAADAAEGWRTWVSTAGTKVEARYKGLIGQAVRLEKRDGKVITVPLNLLSEGDLQWLKQRK